MIKDIIDILKDISLRHKGVRTFRYQSDIYNNAQNNYETYQVYVDDISLSQLNITNGIFKTRFEIYILSQPNSEKPVIDVQTEAFTIATNIMAYIDLKDEYKGILSVYDYSILTLSNYTDDNSAGVKLSLELQVPNPVNLCTLDDNFNDEPYEGEIEEELDINGYPVDEQDLIINTVKLPKNKPNC